MQISAYVWQKRLCPDLLVPSGCGAFIGDAEAWKPVMMHPAVLSGAIPTSAAVLPSLPAAEPVIPVCLDALDKPVR